MMSIPMWHIWFKHLARTEMLFKYPNPAQYPPKLPDGTDPDGPIIYLFVESFFQITGKQPEATIDFYLGGLNHPFDVNGQGFTVEEMLSEYERLMRSTSMIPTEVNVSKRQCNKIHDEIFKPEPELGIE
jgi:hypothetical protein